MKEDNVIKFEYWQEQKNSNFPDVFSTFDGIESIDEGTFFIWSEMTTHMPCSGGAGMWEMLQNIDLLIGYIRHVRLPGFFEIWLKRDEWDNNEDMIKAEELFDRAERVADLKYKEDIPLMKEIIKEIDSLFSLPENQKFERLKSALVKFNDKWDNAGTLSFSIYIYKDAVEVGEELYKRDNELIDETYYDYFGEDEEAENKEVALEQWLEICGNIYSDEVSFDIFMNVLDNSNSY